MWIKLFSSQADRFADNLHPSISHCIFMCIVGSENAREIDEYKVTFVLNECLRDFPHIGVLRKEQKTCIVNLGNTSFLVEKMCMQSCRPASVLPERVAITEQSQEEVIIKREELRAPVQTHIIFRKTSWS